MSCNNCGNTDCQGNCQKKCIKVYKPLSWVSGQTGIPGDDGDPGVGIINIVDNGNNTFTIFLSDATNYTIVMPPFAGKHVTQINPVPGDDTQWELVYDDASTAIISAAFYLENKGVGVELIFNQANHPTWVRTLQAKDSNAKLVVAESVSTLEIDFNVKQYGMQSALIFTDTTGLSNYMTQIPPKFENSSGGTGVVAKNGGGDPISNAITDALEISVEPIDAYKSVLYYRVKQSWDLTYNDTTFLAAVKGRFHNAIAITLPNNIQGVPLDFFINDDYFHMNHTTVMYDIYIDEDDDPTNKLRRYGEHKVCDCLLEGTFAPTDPDAGWYGSGVAGNKLFFRYPYVDNLRTPGVGLDVTIRLTFEAIGSIVCHHDSDTDELSTFAGIKNH